MGIVARRNPVLHELENQQRSVSNPHLALNFVPT